IVFLSGSDPTQTGLAASLARPGSNVTGLTNFAGELRGKRLELLKEVVPQATRFALLEGTTGVARAANISDAQATARTLGVPLKVVEVNADNPVFGAAFQAMTKAHVGALAVGKVSILVLTLNQKNILKLTEKSRLPAIYASTSFTEDGG